MAIATAGDGTRISYDVHGPVDGEPLLLIQGLGADKRGWFRQVRPFTHRYRTIAFDNRGVGGSEVPPGPYDLNVMAQDALAVLDAEGIESAHVVGASMGGIISQILGVLHPERVRSLTLACTGCHHLPWRRELLAGWRDQALENGMRPFVESNSRWLVGSRSLRRFFPIFRTLGGIALNCTPEAFAAQVDAILDADDDLRFELGQIEAPVLILVGSQDILTPLADSEELSEHIPHARLAVVGGGAHGFMFEHAKQFNQAVLTFLDGLRPQTPSLTADVREPCA
jgi:3-oxoadipate enol-lactonase